MKNILKISTTALIIAGANLLFSQSALACSPNDLYYNNCMQDHTATIPQGSGGGGGVISNYLELAWTKDAEPFFHTARVRPNYGWQPEFWTDYDNETVAHCNQSSRRSPCISLVNGCIAITQGSEGKYANMGATCSEAKQKAMQACQAEESNSSTCKIYKTKKS